MPLPENQIYNIAVLYSKTLVPMLKSKAALTPQATPKPFYSLDAPLPDGWWFEVHIHPKD